MCIVCTEWNAGKMSSKEALANIGEMIGDPNNTEEYVEHLLGLSNKIVDKEVPFEDDIHNVALEYLDDLFNSGDDQ
jgi:hypothetical protein